MGCQSSILRRSSVLPDLVFPGYCIRNASLTEGQAGIIAESWAKCIEGTAAWRAHIEVANATSRALSDPVAASDLTSARVLRSVTESPISFIYDTFYGRLFEQYPAVRPLFKGGLATQGRKLVTMIGLAVSLLRNAEALEPALQDLARRHVAYGALCAHYGPVGEVLLYTLERCCGPELWTPELATAWLTAYSVILEIMVPAAAAEELAAATRERRGNAYSVCSSRRTSGLSPADSSSGAAACASPDQPSPTPSRQVTGSDVKPETSLAVCPV